MRSLAEALGLMLADVEHWLRWRWLWVTGKAERCVLRDECGKYVYYQLAEETDTRELRYRALKRQQKAQGTHDAVVVVDLEGDKSA